MRPSKTRSERQAPSNPYLSEQDLKQALELQAAERKRAMQLVQLQEKADLLKHYENYSIGNQHSNDEDFNAFLQKRKEEINAYDEDLAEVQEVFNKRPEKKQKQAFLDKDYDNVANFVRIEDQKGDHPTSQGELDRQKRLRLREEERLRRLHGIKSSAYDSEKGRLTFEEHQSLKFKQDNSLPEKPKNEIFSNQRREPINWKPEANIDRNEQNFEINHENEVKYSSFPQDEKNENNEFPPLKTNSKSEKKAIQSEKFDKMEKQMKYKDELDRQVALKHKEREDFQKPRAISANMEDFKPRLIGDINSNNYGLEQKNFDNPKLNNYNLITSPHNIQGNQNINTNTHNESNNNNMAVGNNYKRPKSGIDFEKQSVIEKKKKYAEELKWQMEEKNQEKFNKKEAFIGAKIQQNDPNEQLIQAKLLEKEKKKKYAEELKQQMLEKNEKKQKNEQFQQNPDEKSGGKVWKEQNDNQIRQIKSVEENYYDPGDHNKNTPFNEDNYYQNNNNYNGNNNFQGQSDNYHQNYNNNINNYQGQMNQNADFEIAPSSNKKNFNPNNKKGILQQEAEKGVAFMNKIENEYKSRENQRKNMKQTYQEDLKKQIEEKNRLKEQEEKRLKEEEQKEMEKLDQERQRMLQEEGFKSKGRKPLNLIMMAQNKESQNNFESPENDIKKPFIEENTVFPEKEQQQEEIFTAVFPVKSPKNNSKELLIFREENHPPPEYQPRSDYYHSDSRSNERFVTYDEFDRQTRALKEAIEDKLRLEKLNVEETEILNVYRSKIKEITEEKQQYEQEIEKLQNLLLKYHSQEKQVDLEFITKALQGSSNDTMKEEGRHRLEGMKSHLKESLQIVESLPTRSNLVYGSNNLDQSFRKDLEIFKAIHWNYFLHESQFIERALEPPKTAPGRQITQENPLKIEKTKFGGEIREKTAETKFHVPLTQPQSQRAIKTPKLFQSLLRSSTQETPNRKKEVNLMEIEEKLVQTENLEVDENEKNKNFGVFEKENMNFREKEVNENNLHRLLQEESEAQSYFVNSNALEERKLPLKSPDEGEEYENEGFEIDDEEGLGQMNEIQMDEAKFNNEERSLVLADEELDEAALERFIESNENEERLETKPMSRAKDGNSSSSKMLRFKKPKTVDVFGKIQNTNNTNEESGGFYRHDKALNRLGSYLDEVERSSYE